jgi:hypothetical protein
MRTDIDNVFSVLLEQKCAKKRSNFLSDNFRRTLKQKSVTKLAQIEVTT